MSSTLAVIPARYASTRFPAKPLVDLCGQSMIERVWRAASSATRIDRVVVATDDERIADHCRNFGAEVVMTSSELLSGTDRVAQAAQVLGSDADIILNVQGDEPLLKAGVLDALVDALRASNADVATPITRISSTADLINPTVCKVTLRSDNTALYFSRSAIPFVRSHPVEQWLEQAVMWKHIGLYAYRAASLQRFIQLPPAALELHESLEQLRLLCDGARYLCVEVADELVAIDTPEDAERVRQILMKA